MCAWTVLLCPEPSQANVVASLSCTRIILNLTIRIRDFLDKFSIRFSTTAIPAKLREYNSVLSGGLNTLECFLGYIYILLFTFLHLCFISDTTAGGTGTDEETQAAEEKFLESKLLAESAMHNLLENDVRNF